MCLQTFHGVEKTPLFYYNNQHQEKRFGGSKKGIRFSKKFFETHRKPHGYWVPVISVTKDRKNTCIRKCFFSSIRLTRVILLRSDIRLRRVILPAAVVCANRIPLRRGRNIPFATDKISRRTK